MWWCISCCLRNKDADEHNIKELNNLPDEPDDQLIDKFGSSPFLQRRRMILIANDKNIPNKPEGRDPDVYREQFNQLKTSEFWAHCHAIEKITLKVGAQVWHLNFFNSILRLEFLIAAFQQIHI